MKQTRMNGLELTGECKCASKSVYVKNMAEGCRCGVLSLNSDTDYSTFYSHRSPEYGYAKKGWMSAKIKENSPIVLNEKGDVVWNQSAYNFLNAMYTEDKAQVHPALWNNGTNNWLSGVFEVLPNKIYQVRGYDMANITFVKTNNVNDRTLQEDDRWMVMDTLMSKECTKAALELFEIYLGSKVSGYVLKGKISGIIISHSHVDHYGGMGEVKNWFVENSGNTDGLLGFTIVPEGFIEHAVSENVYVGNAMARRAAYQYGTFIKPDCDDKGKIITKDYLAGSISIGIGQGQSVGSVSFYSYEDLEQITEITENQKLKLDKLYVEFQLTPGTEAPAEMNNYIDKYKALWLAENCTGTLHNLYTLRGAQVRDGKDWAKFLVESAVLYGSEADVIFQSHNWPHWSKTYVSESDDKSVEGIDVKEFLLDTASIYKYINDQTLLYMNMGYKMNEASDMLTIPRKLQKNWCTMPFYGTPKHNSKAVYQKYLGWYDANPLHLEELLPEQLAQEQMRYMTEIGNGQSIFAVIETDIQKGNYWIAAYMAHQVILANGSPDDVSTAKWLCADALEQLGYQAQSGTWRNAYLSAAYELRNGKGRVSVSSSATVQCMTPEMILDYISILFDGERASSKVNFDGELHVILEKTTECFAFIVRNGAIMYYPVSALSYSNNVISIKRETLLNILAWTQNVENSDWDIYQLLQAADTEAEFLKQITSCMINLTLDRYKYFDIMDRHDSEVVIDDEVETYDLKDVVYDCIDFLNAYKSTIEGGANVINLSGAELEKWQDYYQILMKKSNVILEGDFITADNNDTLGIGKDGSFKPYEYWYTMYSLYRYLGKPYVNNDTFFTGKESEVEDLTKLKKKIQLLESYMPDYYLGGDKDFNKNSVKFDENDCEAWKFLCGTEDAVVEFYATDFFQTLYECYKQLMEFLAL